MTAPMTRERLALIRDGYKPALDDSYSEACVAVDVEDLRELLDACESLLAERESVRDAALEEAIEAIDTVGANTPNAADRWVRTVEAVRALKGKQ